MTRRPIWTLRLREGDDGSALMTRLIWTSRLRSGETGLSFTGQNDFGCVAGTVALPSHTRAMAVTCHLTERTLRQ